MRREIKFRAWDSKAGRMAKKLKLDWHGGVPELNEAFELMQRHSILMQFTGLTDKNGKEIYEGDIIKAWHPTATNDEAIGEVIWATEKYTAWKLKSPKEHEIILGFGIPEKYYEIIGNIYENPDLLQVKEQ